MRRPQRSSQKVAGNPDASTLLVARRTHYLGGLDLRRRTPPGWRPQVRLTPTESDETERGGIGTARGSVKRHDLSTNDLIALLLNARRFVLAQWLVVDRRREERAQNRIVLARRPITQELEKSPRHTELPLRKRVKESMQIVAGSHTGTRDSATSRQSWQAAAPQNPTSRHRSRIQTAAGRTHSRCAAAQTLGDVEYLHQLPHARPDRLRLACHTQRARFAQRAKVPFCRANPPVNDHQH